MNLPEKTHRSNLLSALRLGPALAGPFVWNHYVLLDYLDSLGLTYSFLVTLGCLIVHLLLLHC